jgi:hypothetical protein
MILNHPAQQPLDRAMKYSLIIIAFILTAVFLCADDITTLRGEKFTNVTISRVEPDGIVVIKSDGIVKIPFTDLSPEVRAKYGYDPEKAAQFKTAAQAAAAQFNSAAQAAAAQEQSAADAAAAAKQQQKALLKVKKYRILGRVFQKTAEGLVLKQTDRSRLNFDKHEQADRIAGITYPETGGWFLFLTGHPDQEKLADDDLIDVIGYETGVYSHGGTSYHAYAFYSK